jgi:hypothetical protein
VRSLPEYRIEKIPTLGWCAQNLGFITDMHQINVALTRAKKGLFITVQYLKPIFDILLFHFLSGFVNYQKYALASQRK